ncbi:MAG: adenosylcobalamin-dependent ribonucleoside-diphosphate reductase [Candidatus Micrarchaeota archaeon]|nr:adenosylcobalamin-dependent ribonucleoside-diphosphate reductase [Candidatus Micrarchaeota archaeon]
MNIEKIFAKHSKVAKRVPSEYLERYRELLEALLRNNPIEGDYLYGNELAESIFKRKYYLKDWQGEYIEKDPRESYMRIAAFVGAVFDGEKEAQEFYDNMVESYWIPGGRVIAGAGDIYRLKTLANCFVTLIEDDSIEAIYAAAYRAARTYSYGGGMGVDISVLRPKGSVVHNAADTSTGAVSFMEIYSLTTGLIGQSGRRGALMITIDVKHPDIFEFIKAKSEANWMTKELIEKIKYTLDLPPEKMQQLERKLVENQVRFANISIKFTDEFFQALEEQEKYGGNKLLVYRMKKPERVMEIPQDIENVHYSFGIPSKDISNYEFVGAFDSLSELNSFLESKGKPPIREQDLKDPTKRDVYGDYVIDEYAIRYSGDFLLYFSSVKTGSIKRLVKARDIWNRFVEGNYRAAEPGLIFWSKMKKYSNSDYVGRPIVGTNPCSEVPLEPGGACNLASLNLSRFVKHPFTESAEVDFELLDKALKSLVRFMDNVVEWNTYLHPLEEQRQATRLTRRVGIGVMGIADMFLQLGLGYDSEEALQMLEKVLSFIANKAYRYSADLAQERGTFDAFSPDLWQSPFIKEALTPETQDYIKNGIRNVALLSIAPTGTISNIAISFKRGKNYIGVSGGIEPIFALYYKRYSESLGKSFNVFHSTVQAYLDMKGIDASELNEESLKNVLPWYFFRTAHKIDPIMRVKIQGVAQKYIDHSISSTVNLPEDIHPEVISQIYIQAWKEGLKGITVYREGSRFAVLSTGDNGSDFSKYKTKRFKIKTRNNKEYVVYGDEVIILPNQKLTTPYHYLKGDRR